MLRSQKFILTNTRIGCVDIYDMNIVSFVAFWYDAKFELIIFSCNLIQFIFIEVYHLS